ncbi:hypothetical protein BGX33_002848 [Mortierella sp. NVP41]|nr:hypothetical protein BGX33_002848 [Mortierella sp. NVP41]
MTKSTKNNPPSGAEITPKGKSVLTRLKNSVKKALRLSANAEDCTLAYGLATVHAEKPRIMNRFGRFAKDESGTDDTGQDQVILDDTNPAIFLENVGKPFLRTPLPKLGNRFNSTLQLAFGLHLLPKKTPPPTPTPGLVITSVDDTQDMILHEDEQAWMGAMDKDPIEQERIRWLAAQIVSEFLKTTHKDAASIAEVVLLGSVLDRKDFRGTLSSLIRQLEQEPLLDIDLSQGLVQLLLSASPGYLIDDDFARVLRVLRRRLKDTYEQLGDVNRSVPAHIYQLASAVSRVLDLMAEGNIKGLNRTEDHKPLLDILAGLKHSSDPYLKFQASYAYQALQYVGDDESPLRMALRVGGGIAVAALGAASVFKLDPENLFKGLRELGQAAGQAFDVAKAGIEGAQALRVGGEGVMGSVLKGFRSGARRAWYPALQGARAFIREGRLADFKGVVYEAPCRCEREFQWGVCQLLGEIAMDPVWDVETRQQAVDFLEELRRDDTHWTRHSSINTAIVVILHQVSEDAEQIIQHHSASILQDLAAASVDLPTPYPLRSRFPLPTTSSLLAKVLKIPSVEYDLHRMMTQRLQEYQQTIYIPPRAKTSLCASDKDAFSLMDKVKDFLESDRQVFLVLGDSGAGKSTFNKHLEHELLKSYKQGDPIPLFINLPAIDNPHKELIPEQLRTLDFTDDNIREMKRDRQFFVICDGYDESHLAINLHSTNSFNRPGQWEVKMVISCRSTYVGQDYRDRFQPEPPNKYSPATPHLVQEAVVVPFSSNQIKDYVEQFVRDTEVHELFNGRPVWSSEEYMDKLVKVPKLMSLASNPFLLNLSLRTLPKFVADVQDLTEVLVSRSKIYEVFVEQWLDINKRRLRSMRLSKEETSTLEELIDAGFTQIVVKHLKDLATAIFKEQDGNPVVRYLHRDDKSTWKATFFGPNAEATLLRDASPLTRAGALHRFIHRSLLEYFYTFEEHEVHQFRNKRFQGTIWFRQRVYVPLYAKASLQASDFDTFPLMDKLNDFLSSDRKVFLLHGDSGSGKTTVSTCLELHLLDLYNVGGHIPLCINLYSFETQEEDLISQQLRRYNFSTDVIQNLKEHRQFIIICDGFNQWDSAVNIHISDWLNSFSEWNIRLVITCRTNSLDDDYRHQFELGLVHRYGPTEASLFQEAVLVPFSKDQVRHYIKEYVTSSSSPSANHRPEWNVKGYTDELFKIPNVMRLVSKPFYLAMTVAVLPSVVRCDLDPAQICTRLGLYDIFQQYWRQYQFRRDSILEYIYSLVIFDPFDPGRHFLEYDLTKPRALSSFVNHPLNRRSIVHEPGVLQYLAERLERYHSFRAQLFVAIRESRTDADVSQAAMNAVAILIRAGVLLDGVDLSDIPILEPV